MFIRQLSYVVALAKERHFGRAAAVCNVSQPALSGAIRGIEEELGVVIIQRGRRFEGFTEDGERVLAWARRVLADCEHLRQDARAGREDPAGVLRMGVIPASLPLVPTLTQYCLERYPRMRHQVYTLSATEILRKLGDFELDIGVSYLDDERLGSFRTLPIFCERYVLVAADAEMFEGAETASWEHAATLPLCLFSANLQCRRGIDAAFAAAGKLAAPAVETDSMTALYAHVKRTRLFSILPHSVLCLTETSERLHSIPMIPRLERQIGLVYRDQQPVGPIMSAALRGFRELDMQGRIDALLAN
ncbi:LysR family transcriptional regulator [Cupriavidus pauculus]|uniref:LysR family transcriptional regulator n=1 Tax=Cupriavidus pauculus TaxID=82633 RepID=UPI001EE36307|nr:LysR family transcriptional regulator [Cupriavidus pauculus]GJG97626.1 LysR family transcriptional regulator [Cupriavidus pauculus]